MVALKVDQQEIKPFLKWAGGKRQLLPALFQYMPAQFGTYYEPFIGGGALLFALAPYRAVIGDSNAELINCYRVIRDSHQRLISELKAHRNEKDYFYTVRAWDREAGYCDRLPVERAGRIIYLNRTCYNGLYRVNQRGEFNAPFGRYKKPTIVNAPLLSAVSEYLGGNDIKIQNQDFASIVAKANKGDFIYFDPPYDPVSETASFTGYGAGGFARSEQRRLKRVVDTLTLRGVKVLLSNSNTQFIRELYREYRCVEIHATRTINSKGTKRGKVSEVLVMNY